MYKRRWTSPCARSSAATRCSARRDNHVLYRQMCMKLIVTRHTAKQFV